MAEQPTPPGKLVGYMRVSTDEQDFRLQRDALIAAGVKEGNIFSDKMTGSRMDRAGLKRAVKVCWPGDTIVVWKLDRLGRSTIGVLQQLDELNKAEVGIRSLTENLDTKTHTGKFVMTILAAFAQMERDMISERTKAGLKAYQDRGGKMGPKHSILDNPKRLAKFKALHKSGQLFLMSGSQIVQAMNDADPKAKPIKGSQVYFNWKRRNFAGLELDLLPEGNGK
jgi:DNA invertase Pin-like site-specific DNA recombinase